jgi:hypothetical protein
LGESGNESPNFGTTASRNPRVHSNAHQQATGHSLSILTPLGILGYACAAVESLWRKFVAMSNSQVDYDEDKRALLKRLHRQFG